MRRLAAEQRRVLATRARTRARSKRALSLTAAAPGRRRALPCLQLLSCRALVAFISHMFGSRPIPLPCQEEIIYELREHSAGLNCGRWDYIFS